MAHDVLIAGALFPDVPSVQFPDSQQQWHSFTDVSDTTAAAADVAQGKVFYDAQGTLTQGTASGGGGGDADLKGLIERTVTTMTLPSDLTAVGDSAFRGCANLSLDSLPSGVTVIGQNAFSGCSSLSLTSLPSGVTSIGLSAFYGCSSLALTSLPSGVTSIGSSAFQGCTNLALTSLPSGMTDIATTTFRSCTSLALTSLPDSVSNIGANAFYDCSSLALTKLPSSLTAVNGCFQNCTSLTSLDVPQSVANIYANSFYGCSNLTTMVLRRTSFVALANVSAFSNTPMRGYGGLSGTIYVPSALINTYKTATNWKTIFNAGYLTFAAIEGSAWEL